MKRLRNASPTIANAGRAVQVAVGVFFLFFTIYTDVLVRLFFPGA